MSNIININDKNKSYEITPIEKISLQKESSKQEWAKKTLISVKINTFFIVILVILSVETLF